MRAFAFVALLMVACGPQAKDYTPDGGPGGDGDGGIIGQPDANFGPTATLTGTVWAPGNGPGMVPSGHEIPIYDAVVYVSPSRPAGIPQMVHCDQCVDPPGRHVFTDHNGNFTLSNIIAGTWWLVIQKGQFRLEQQLVLGGNDVVNLTAAQTTLPSEHDPANGKWIPKIALASGLYDHIEDILGKMGLGEVNSSGAFVGTSAAGVFDLYSNGGRVDAYALESFSSFLSDYGKMSQYHIIFVPCSTQTFGGTGLSGAPTQVLQNLRQFVADGGKLYVTDWSAEYADNIFPEQIRFESSIDTPASAWNGTSWNTGQFGSGDGFSSFMSNHSYAVDDDLRTWLDGQQGPVILSSFNYSTGTVNASDFVIEGKYDYINELVQVQIGTDDEGLPVYDTPKAWVIGSEDSSPASCAGGGAGCSPFTVTFEPTGCGRVLYSTYHTAEDNHAGLLPQERILLYLIMEIGVCKSGPIIE